MVSAGLGADEFGEPFEQLIHGPEGSHGRLRLTDDFLRIHGVEIDEKAIGDTLHAAMRRGNRERHGQGGQEMGEGVGLNADISGQDRDGPVDDEVDNDQVGADQEIGRGAAEDLADAHDTARDNTVGEDAVVHEHAQGQELHDVAVACHVRHNLGESQAQQIHHRCGQNTEAKFYALDALGLAQVTRKASDQQGDGGSEDSHIDILSGAVDGHGESRACHVHVYDE